MQRLGWALAAVFVLSACGSGPEADEPTETQEPERAAVVIPDVVRDSSAEASRRLAAARDLVIEDNTLSIQLLATADLGVSISLRNVVDLGDEESESILTYDYGIDGPYSLQARVVGQQLFGRPEGELCWFDYGEVEEGTEPWVPTALRLATEAEAVGVAAGEESQVLAEVSALVALSAVTTKLVASLPPSAQDSAAVVPVVVTLDDDGRLVRAAFNYEDALDALSDDGVDLASLVQDDPELAGASAGEVRDSLAASYVTTYTPTFGVEVEMPTDDERVDVAGLDPSDPDAPIECGASS